MLHTIRQCWVSCPLLKGPCPLADGNRKLIGADDDDADHWFELLAFIYPLFPRPTVTWANVEPVYRLSHKYNVRCTLKMCNHFLMVPQTEFSIHPDADNYVCKWLDIGEQTHFDALCGRCIDFVQDQWASMACFEEVSPITGHPDWHDAVSSLIVH